MDDDGDAVTSRTHGPPPAAASPPRERIGPYQVLGALGTGGSAVVVRARAPDGRVVAVKVLRLRTPGLAARFAREARLLAELGPGFVPLLDHGIDVGPDGHERPYLVLPLLEGGTLRERLERSGPLAVDDAVALGATLARALARAHALGAVHRDLKPANVLFDSEDRPHVADLGLGVDAEGALGEATRLTATHEVGGTPGYMAPEQLDGLRLAGPAADVFGLAATIYEALVGQAPFECESLVEKLARAAQGRARPLRDARPDVPTWLADLVHAGLDPRPDARPTALALARALLRGPAAAGGTKRRRPRRAALVLAAGVAVASLAWAVTRGPTRDGPATSEPASPESTAPLATTVAAEASLPAARPATPRLEGARLGIVWSGGEDPACVTAVGWPRPDQAMIADRGGRVRSVDPQQVQPPKIDGEVGARLDTGWSAGTEGFVTGDAGGFLRVWPTSPGRLKVGLRTHARSTLLALTGHADRVVTLDDAGSIGVWDLGALHAARVEGRFEPVWRIRLEGAQAVTVVELGATTRVAVGTSTGHVAVLDGTPTPRRLVTHDAGVTALAPCAAGLVLGDARGAVLLVPLHEAGAPSRLGQHARGVVSLVTSLDGRLVASISDDATLLVWRPPGPGPIATVDLAPALDAPTCAAFAPDGQALLLGTRLGWTMRLDLP